MGTIKKLIGIWIAPPKRSLGWFSVFLGGLGMLLSLSSALWAETVQLLNQDGESFRKRIELIDAANCQIDAASYEIGDDQLTLHWLAHLRLAARRGVAVRIITDGHNVNNLIPKAMMGHLIDEGIQIREHQPDARYQLELGSSRMHDKLLIVDSYYLVTGGRNMRADYFGQACKNFLDRDIYLTGCVACEASNYYCKRWAACTSGKPTLARPEAKKFAERQEHAELNQENWDCAKAKASCLLDGALATEFEFCDCGRCVMDPMEIDPCRIRFLHDHPDGSKKCSDSIARELENLLRNAKCSIDLETPYFAISLRLQKVLHDASRRGVRIRILTNSLETTDHPIVHAQYAHLRRRLRRHGIELFELHGERHLHAKAAIVDGRYAMVGSYNFDMLSEKRNSEVGVLIDSAEFAEQLAMDFSLHLNMSKHVPSKGLLFRYDAKNNNVSSEDLRKLQWKRVVSPFIRRYL